MKLTDKEIGICVLDDNPDTCEAVKLLLNIYGFENVRTFTDYRKLLADLRPDDHIYIVDYLLKDDKTGIQVIREILIKQPHAKFIMLSGQDEKSVVVEYNNSHFGGRYIDKGTNEEIAIIEGVRELVTNIGLVERIYTGMNEMKNGHAKMINILKNET